MVDNGRIVLFMKTYSRMKPRNKCCTLHTMPCAAQPVCICVPAILRLHRRSRGSGGSTNEFTRSDTMQDVSNPPARTRSRMLT